MMRFMWPGGKSSLRPTWTEVTNRTPSFFKRFTRRWTTPLASFMPGIPYISSPPIRSDRSKTVTSWPTLFSCAAALRPAGPEPTTATRLPVRATGGAGSIQPSAKPRSTIAFSIFLIVTGGSITPSTQLPSQGAGQTRPVNSGKLFVLWSRSRASRQRPL